MRNAAISSIALLLPFMASAAVDCTLTDFVIDAYDHTGVYVHGKLNGTQTTFIILCGSTSGVQDCASKATDRRLAVALAAQASGKSLIAHFSGGSSCSSIPSYTIVTLLRISP